MLDAGSQRLIVVFFIVPQLPFSLISVHLTYVIPDGCPISLFSERIFSLGPLVAYLLLLLCWSVVNLVFLLVVEEQRNSVYFVQCPSTFGESVPKTPFGCNVRRSISAVKTSELAQERASRDVVKFVRYLIGSCFQCILTPPSAAASQPLPRKHCLKQAGKGGKRFVTIPLCVRFRQLY